MHSVKLPFLRGTDISVPYAPDRKITVGDRSSVPLQKITYEIILKLFPKEIPKFSIFNFIQRAHSFCILQSLFSCNIAGFLLQ